MVAEHTAESIARSFGAWLAGELAARGWSAAELSRRTGWPDRPGAISRNTVGSYVTGKRVPRARSCGAIARGLGLPAEAVMLRAGVAGEADEPAPDSLRGHARELVNQLPDELLQAAVWMLDGLRDGARRRALAEEES